MSYTLGKYSILIENGKSHFYINGQHEHSFDYEFSEQEFEEHVRLAAETFDFNYSE